MFPFRSSTQCIWLLPSLLIETVLIKGTNSLVTKSKGHLSYFSSLWHLIFLTVLPEHLLLFPKHYALKISLCPLS